MSIAPLAQLDQSVGVRVAHKKIRLRKQAPEAAKKIEQEFKVSPVAARILAARGFEADTNLKNFLNPTLKDSLPSPDKLKNLGAACKLIKSTIDAGGAIAVCSDFDVDGLSGGAQVVHFLRAVGAIANPFVPDRFTDGYGLNEAMIKTIADQGHSLLIAIDYGTTNQKELSLAKSLGLKTIVLDHHHVGQATSPADVFINPQQKGCGFADKILSASGLAWYLLVGLKQKLPQAKDIEARSYLELACLGTICDMVPLIGPNRTIAKKGLEYLAQSKSPGLMALRNAIGVHGEVSCTDVSFGIGPRLNAAGRMVHGEMVIELLTTSDSVRAPKIAQRLNKLNADRQDVENRVKEAAMQLIRDRGELPHGIVVWDEQFHTGVVGIVAQRLVESFYRPSVVLGLDKPGIFKGSVRGIKGFSVVEALAAVSDCLIKYGGHEGAGGLSLAEEKLEEFAIKFNAACMERLEGIETNPRAEVDTEVDLIDLSPELVNELSTFAPFGMGNPGPVLLARELKVMEVKVLKNAHLKAVFSDGKRYLTGLMWRQTNHPALLTGAMVNVAFRPDLNSFGGKSEVQANLQAIEQAGE